MRRLSHPVRRLTQPLLLSALLLSSGCVSMHYTQDPLEHSLINQQPAQGLETLEQLNHRSRDQVLYHLNKAVLLRMQGDFEESNNELESAKQISAKLEAISIREQAAAVTVNDAMRSYLPAPFERAMIYCLKIINHLELNDMDGARVETLQLDVFLKQKYEKNEPPFARYLSGLVFEANRELSDALIAYRKAYEAYKDSNLKLPLQLKKDLLRLTQQQGLNDEHKKYLEKFELEAWPSQSELNQQGEVISFLFSGLVPHKHETAINAQDPRSGQLHRIAIPFYETRITQVQNASINNKPGEPFANLDRQATASLDDQMPGIITRAIARVSVKNKFSDNMAEQSPLLGVVTNIAGFISEQADTRGWYSLPQEIIINRIALAPGDQQIDFKLKGTAGTTITGKTTTLTSLKAGEKQFQSWHWPASTVTSKRDDHARIKYSATVHYRVR